MSRVLFINPGWEQEPLLKRLSSCKDLEIFAVSPTSAHLGSQQLFAGILCTNLFDIQNIVDFAICNRIQAVISDQCDFSLYAHTAVAHALNLPSMSTKSAYLSNNKYLQRLKSQREGILTPKYQLCLGAKDAFLFGEEAGYPIILKPADNRGSIGVVKVSSPDEVEAAFILAMSSSRSQLVLAEEFIDGIQFTVDGYIQANQRAKSLAIGEKIMLSDRVQVAMGISYPATLDQEDYNKLLCLNEDVNQKLGYDFGMTHSEYMMRDGDFYLIESSNRGGGCFTSEIIIPEVTQVDLLSHFISECLGTSSEDQLLPEFIQQNPVTLRFFSLPKGKFKGVANWDKLMSAESCILGHLNVKPDDSVLDITNDGNRHGFFIVRGDADSANDLINTMEFEK